MGCPQTIGRLSSLEKSVLEETNQVRTNPADYAKKLEGIRPYFKGKLFQKPGQSIALRTQEGVRAVDEAIRALRASSVSFATNAS